MHQLVEIKYFRDRHDFSQKPSETNPLT